MSDSDSDALPARSSAAPSTTKLESTLRDVVQDLQRSGKSDELTVNSVRAAAESRLGIEAGFFKDGSWKEKSKAIIRDQADKEPSPEREQTEPKLARGKKRKSPDTDKPKRKQQKQKKQRINDKPENESSDQDKLRASSPRINDHSENKTTVDAATDESSLSDLDKEDEERDETQKPTAAVKNPDSESELSVLDDEDEPPPKKRGKKKDPSSSAEAQTKKKEKPSKGKKQRNNKRETDTAAATAAAASDPDKEEIKRLQGWLVKCGIRKLWGKELAPYESGKAKIKHLRDMLADAGMTGRYSQEKARQIKESRELAADLEAVREGEKMWGTNARDGASEEEEKDSKPRRRLAKGLKELDFISDGEETD